MGPSGGGKQCPGQSWQLIKCTCDGGWSCCSSTNQCDVDQGDCDSDADCKTGLKCGSNNFKPSTANNYNSNSDCCYKPSGSVINGNWGSWTSWSTCDNGGQRSRRRSCNNPAPSGGGAPCSGSSVQSIKCTCD